MCKQKLEKEFEEFFIHCLKVNNQELKIILQPLKTQLLKQKLKKVLKITFLLATICFAIYYVDTLNWYFCAVGRIIMIQLLPVWNWTNLADAKCLIPKATSSVKTSEIFRTLNSKDCRVCEHFDNIIELKKTSYKFIYNKFLIRGLPVIVSDAAPALRFPESIVDFIDDVTQNMSSIVKEEACNLETNLMMSRYATVEESFTILRDIFEVSVEMPPWFLSFRNCRFEALKASRLMMKKPYFYPLNLQAPSSSWILLSQNYPNFFNDLKLYGLVIVTQLKGTIRITLKAKEDCQNICHDLTMKLFPGESLVFLTNLMTFSYEYLAEKNFSLTFITETDFD